MLGGQSRRGATRASKTRSSLDTADLPEEGEEQEEGQKKRRVLLDSDVPI